MLKAIRHAEFTHKQGSFTTSRKHMLLVLNHKESRPLIACNKPSKPPKPSKLYKPQTLNLLHLQIPPRFLFPFQCFKQCFKISFSKTLSSLALNKFKK